MSSVDSTIIAVYLNGSELPVLEEPKLNTGIRPTTGKKGIGGKVVAKTKGEAKIPSITVKVADTNGLTVAGYEEVADATIVAECQNGKRYTFGGAYYHDSEAINKAEWKVTFQAERFSEQGGEG